MVMPSLFPPARQHTINYDWIDMAGATGFILYDCWARDPNFTEGGAVEFEGHLSQSNDMDELTGVTERGRIRVYAPASSTSITSVKLIDLDFDATEFQLPAVMKGTALIRVPMYFDMVAAASTCYYYTRVRIRKWDGSSETEIATGTSRIYGDSIDYEYALTIPVVIPHTHFKKGEQLRLTIEMWARNQNDTHAFALKAAFDPLDAAFSGFTAGNSRLTAAIPYRIEI